MRETSPPGRMRYSWEARCGVVQRILAGSTPAQAASHWGMSRATGYRLWRRFQQDGWDGLRERPPVARHVRHRLSEAAERQILELRAKTGWGPARLASMLGRPPATVWRVLHRHGLSRRAAAPRRDARRYEYAAPGDLVHLDIKKLGRFWQPGKRALAGSYQAGGRQPNRRAGWQYVHVCVDDHSRLAHAVILPGEGGDDCARALELHLAWLAERGIEATRVRTDNGTGYRSKRFAETLKARGLKHSRTRAYHPWTNGKAEAFVGILQREWAYGHIWHSSAARTRALPGWIRRYNTHRPHGSLNGPPISRVSQAQRSYI